MSVQEKINILSNYSIKNNEIGIKMIANEWFVLNHFLLFKMWFTFGSFGISAFSHSQESLPM